MEQEMKDAGVGQEQVFELHGPRSTLWVFAKGLTIGMGKAQGRLHGGATLEAFPRLRAIMRDVEIDGDRVRHFDEVCGIAGDGETASPAYPEILFLDMLATLVTSRAFPLGPLGLIHTEQRIIQHGLLRAGERVDLDCTLAALRDTGKGFEADCAMEVRVGDELRWEGVATFLSRDMKAKGGKKTDASKPEPPRSEPLVVEVPADTGRRYAKVSKDYNPHHLYPITARFFGYKRPIAHGMWTLGRATAQLDESWRMACPLTAVARFRKPILLPATVHIHVTDTNESEKRVDVLDPRNASPHLTLDVKRAL